MLAFTVVLWNDIDPNLCFQLHRECLHDDNFGVGEPLTEKAFNKGLVARGSHYLVYGSTNNNNPDGKFSHMYNTKKMQCKFTKLFLLGGGDILLFLKLHMRQNTILIYHSSSGRSVAAQERILAQNKILSAWTFLSSTQGLSFSEYQAKYKMEVSILTQSYWSLDLTL